MIYNCIRCGKFIAKLDMRKIENKDEYPLLCSNCLESDIKFARKLFE